MAKIVNRHQVRGLDETFNTLKKMSPELHKQSQKRLKKDAMPMVMDARSRVPDIALSNWKTGAAVGGKAARSSTGFPRWGGSKSRSRINTSFKRQKVRGYAGKARLFSLVQREASGAVFEVAGRVNQSRFADNLSRKWGRPSRAVWPAAEKHRGDVIRSVEQAKFEMEDVINAELRSRGYKASGHTARK